MCLYRGEVKFLNLSRSKRRHSMTSRRGLGFLIYGCGASILFIILGILFISLRTVIYEVIVNNNYILVPGNQAYGLWEKTPMPVSLKLVLFNWTNPHEIYNESVKPHFQEIGPYNYIETKEKANITWNSNNTVTYKHLKRWWFDPENSNGSLYDTYVSINPISLSAAYAARDWHYVVKKGLSMTMSTMTKNIHIERPVGQVLFDGYVDPLLTIASKLPMLAKNNVPKMEKFGWFYGRNGSTDFDGIFNMNTGVEGQIGELKFWKYMNQTPYYPDHCGRFERASAGDFFSRPLRKESIIKFFSPDLCRYVELEFEEEVVINGLVGYKYSAQDRFLDNGTKIPENKCFCDGNCMPYGALNVSNCRHGSPAFVTLPRFYKADPSYLDAIEGIEPSHHTDNFYMVFEPKTGIPLQVAARLQLNLQLQPISSIMLYEKVPTVYFPLLYFEQFVSIPESMTFPLKMLVNFEVICTSIGLSLIGAGVLIFIVTCYKLCTTNLFGRKRKPHYTIKEEVPLKH